MSDYSIKNQLYVNTTFPLLFLFGPFAWNSFFKIFTLCKWNQRIFLLSFFGSISPFTYILQFKEIEIFIALWWPTFLKLWKFSCVSDLCNIYCEVYVILINLVYLERYAEY